MVRDTQRRVFEAEFQGEERDGRRTGTVHLFRLRDVRCGRDELNRRLEYLLRPVTRSNARLVLRMSLP